MAKESNDGYCWCPVCKYWVPEQYMISEYDQVENVLVQMCTNCGVQLGDTSLPTFEHKPFRYDPTHNILRCPLCGCKSPKTFEYDPRAKRNDPNGNYRKWHCGNCNRDFRWYG